MPSFSEFDRQADTHSAALADDIDHQQQYESTDGIDQYASSSLSHAAPQKPGPAHAPLQPGLPEPPSPQDDSDLNLHDIYGSSILLSLIHI